MAANHSYTRSVSDIPQPQPAAKASRRRHHHRLPPDMPRTNQSKKKAHFNHNVPTLFSHSARQFYNDTRATEPFFRPWHERRLSYVCFAYQLTIQPSNQQHHQHHQGTSRGLWLVGVMVVVVLAVATCKTLNKYNIHIV